jgi:hypothetical protein
MPRHTQTVKPHIALTLVDDVPDNIRLNLRGVDYVCEFYPIVDYEEDIAHEAWVEVSEKESFWFVFNWNNKPGKMRLIHRVMINKTSWYENAHCPTQKTVSIYRTYPTKMAALAAEAAPA